MHYDTGFNNVTKMGSEGAGILYTVLSVLEMILLEVLGSEGEDDLGRGGSSSSSSSISPGSR
jgi:hypothetical protein